MTDEYMTVTKCEERHKQLMDKLDEVNDSVKEMNNRMYRDNGHISIQTRLDRGDRILGLLCWFTNISIGAIIIGAIAFAWKVIVHVGP